MPIKKKTPAKKKVAAKKKPAKKKPAPKSELPALYEKLREAWNEKQTFMDERRKVFTKLADFNEEIEACQAKIKKELQAQYKGKDSGEYAEFECDTFVISVQAKNGLNEEELLKVHGKTLKKIKGLVVTKTFVDKKVLANCIKDDLLGDIDVRAFRDAPMTPSVFFKAPTTQDVEEE